MIMFQKLRILPLLVLVASLCFVVRAGDFALSITAFAQHEVEVDAPVLPGDDEEHSAVPPLESVDGHGDDASLSSQSEGEKEEKNEEWKDATEAEFDYSEVKMGLYKDLAARREALESSEKSLAGREALLEAAERELDQKLREMIVVRNEIQGLLKKQSDEEQGRIISLVKIYEGMKAKDAARIFNTLDMDVLLSMMSRMSERKSSPILAEMSADRARAVTILLAQQKQIPSIPPQ